MFWLVCAFSHVTHRSTCFFPMAPPKRSSNATRPAADPLAIMPDAAESDSPSIVNEPFLKEVELAIAGLKAAWPGIELENSPKLTCMGGDATGMQDCQLYAFLCCGFAFVATMCSSCLLLVLVMTLPVPCGSHLIATIHIYANILCRRPTTRRVARHPWPSTSGTSVPRTSSATTSFGAQPPQPIT